jgi:ABC-type nitrate/sulfonate/bicarbonate transport system substrate-binding protein
MPKLRAVHSAPSSAPTELWYTRCPVPTTSGIAQHFRWLHAAFAREGIALASIRASSDPAVRQSHFDHTHPNMFREGGNAPPIWARANGQDTAVVAITWVDEEQVILVRPDSDIHTLADLKGRRLGLPKQLTTGHVDVGRAQDLRGLLTALSLAGLRRDEVRFVDVDTDVSGGLREQVEHTALRRHATSDALLGGRVDAIYAKGAVSATLIASHGLRAIVDFNSYDDPLVRINAGTPRPVTVDRALAVNHPEIVARYLAVLLRTAEWAKDHPDEVVRAVAAETASGEDAVRRGYGPELHRHFEPKLSAEYVHALELQKNFFLDEGFLAGDIDFRTWILPGPLALARKLAPTIALADLADLSPADVPAAAA